MQHKIKFFAKIYNKNLGTNLSDDKFSIKWDRELTGYAAKNIEKSFENEKIVIANYRPFFKQYFYYDKHFNGMTYQFPNIIPFGRQNKSLSLCISGIGFSKSFQALAINSVPSLDILEKTQCLPLYAYDKNGAKQDNITDWALQQFTQQYDNQAITKEQIFYYVYAVLHAPAYRTAYEQNLKRDFPRIPFYADFNQYAVAGKQLADLHLGYETVAPYPLEVVEKQVVQGYVPKAKLKADKTNHCIEIDDITKLCGVPEAAWDYKLGNRSALEWVLDQYKESKPTDKTILEHFNTYRFADYKQKVIELLMRVCRVSVETEAIIKSI